MPQGGEEEVVVVVGNMTGMSPFFIMGCKPTVFLLVVLLLLFLPPLSHHLFQVRLLQSLDHPNIVKYLDSFLDGSELVIVVEWAAAGDLKRQIRKALEVR